MKHLRHIARIAGIAAPWGLLGAQSALGQTTAATTAAEGYALEEVVVTAQKREESLREVPISIVSLSADSLEKITVRSFTDVGFAVPGLRLSQHPTTAFSTRLFIRGVGNNDAQITQDPAVGVYQDGVYIARSTGLAFDFGDVERVEVLRGPQGTLYGRNTTGGAINIVTRKPTGVLGFSGEASYGNLDYSRILGKIELPAVGGLATSLTALYTRRDGLVDNSGVGKDFGAFERKGGRLAANWTVSDEFSAYLTYEYSDETKTPFYYQDADVLAGPPGFYNFFIPAEPERVNRAALAAPVRDSTLKTNGTALTLNAALGGLTLRSISAYRDLDASVYMDFSGNPNFTLFRTDPQDTRQHQFSEELQLLGDSFDQRLRYIVGAYYFREGAHQAEQYDAGAFVISNRFITADNEAQAVFANLTGKLTDRLELTVGGRYSRDKRTASKYSIDFTTPDPATAVPPFAFLGARSRTFSKFNPSGTLSFKVSDQVNTYAKIVSGYRAGGFGSGSASKADFERGFNAENMTSYEVGVKLLGWDDRLQLNSAVFYSKYKDVLIDIAVLGAPQYVASFNAGKATIQGTELDLTVLPFESLRLDLSYAYLNTRYDSVTDPQSGADVTGNYKFVNAPRHSANLTAQQKLAQIGSGRLDLALNYGWQARVLTTAPYLVQPGARIPAYGLLNARLTFGAPAWGGQAEVSLWGRNLTNKEYIVDDFGGFPWTKRIETFGEPRTFGLDLAFKF